MNSNTIIFKLFPIDWQALAAVATFAAVAVALYEFYYFMRREKEIKKRETIEKIISPLKESLESLINWLPQPYAYNWVWKFAEIKKNNPYLILNLSPELVEKIEIFNNEFEKFRNLSNQTILKFKEIIASVIMSHLKLAVDGENALNSYYRCNIGGRHIVVNISEPILKGIDLDTCLSEYMSKQILPNKKIDNAEFIVSGFSKKFSKESFDMVIELINNEMSKNKEIKDYIAAWQNIFGRARDLEDRIKV